MNVDLAFYQYQVMIVLVLYLFVNSFISYKYIMTQTPL